MTTDRAWILDAACAQLDEHDRPKYPSEWWDGVSDGERSKRREKRQAKAIEICATCPVTAECLADAVPGEDEGIRAGEVMPPVLGNARRDLAQFRSDGRLRPAIQHGTEGGFTAHKRRGEEPCRWCREGYNAARRERDQAKREAS